MIDPTYLVVYSQICEFTNGNISFEKSKREKVSLRLAKNCLAGYMP